MRGTADEKIFQEFRDCPKHDLYRPDMHEQHVPNPNINPTISVAEAAKLLGVSRAALYRNLDDVATISIAGKTRVLVADLREQLGLPRVPIDPSPPARHDNAAEGHVDTEDAR